jgi:carboxyl-terminal processing protease
MSSRARLLVALVSTGLIGYVAVGSLLTRVLGDTSYGQLAIFNEVVRLVIDDYVEPVNIDRAMAGARVGMADALDGDSAYLDPEQFRHYEEGTSDEQADVGLVLTRRFAFLMVVAARPGSPADKAGLRAGDLVKSIDGRHCRPIPAVVGERLLRGAPGSTVTLGVLRAGTDPFEVSVVRERILPTPPDGHMLDGGVGYLRVTDFTPETGEALRTRIGALERAGATKMVLDLRDAAWGDPAEGKDVAELFLHGGTVAKEVGRSVTEQDLVADPARTTWTGPLAVLVDSGSAGPAEVAAAALLDAKRASVVGERTFGRAAVSRAVPLPEGGLVLTVAKYMSPSGKSIHGEGVEPSVPVAPAEPDEYEEAARPPETPRPDRILEKALEVLAAPPAAAAPAA